MNDETHSSINYKSNPLHGLSLKHLVSELVEHYGFDILQAYINLNCFKSNASIDSSIKFLKKTDWAREKVESFYLYEFKNLPRASNEQFELSPRDRIIPAGQVPGEPTELSVEDGQRLQAKRAKKAVTRGKNSRHATSKSSRRNERSSLTSSASNKSDNPWGSWEE